MRWVKETFPPRERARWLLITMRLSASSLAGTARTLVAVGTVSEAFMFLTTLAAAPRSGTCLAPAAGAFAVAGLAALPSLGFAAVAGWVLAVCGWCGWACSACGFAAVAAGCFAGACGWAGACS